MQYWEEKSIVQSRKRGHAGGGRVHVWLRDAADAIKLKRAEMSPALTLANH